MVVIMGRTLAYMQEKQHDIGNITATQKDLNNEPYFIIEEEELIN